MEWDDSFFFLHHHRGIGHLRDADVDLPCDHEGWILAVVLFGVIFSYGRGFEHMFAEKQSEIVSGAVACSYQIMLLPAISKEKNSTEIMVG